MDIFDGLSQNGIANNQTETIFGSRSSSCDSIESMPEIGHKIYKPKPIRLPPPSITEKNNCFLSMFNTKLKIEKIISQNDFSISDQVDYIRKLKVQKYLDKKHKRSKIKTLKYECRQRLAQQKMRYQGRFINPEMAKDLIKNGKIVYAKDIQAFESMFPNDNELVTMLKKTQLRKPIFKTIIEPRKKVEEILQRTNNEEAIFNMLEKPMEICLDQNPINKFIDKDILD